MTDARTEAGYSKSHPGPRAKANRHTWRLVWREFRVEKHVCTHCLLVRVKKGSYSAFPTLEYRSVDGIVTQGKAPVCA